MNETATPETAAAPKPAKAPRKAKKAGASKPARAKAKAAPAESNGRARKDGLRKSQIRILKCLNRNSVALTKTQICEKIAKEFPTAGSFQGWMSSALGTFDKIAAKAMEKRLGFRSLMTLGCVKGTILDVDGIKETVYEITAAGRKAIKHPE